MNETGEIKKVLLLLHHVALMSTCF